MPEIENFLVYIDFETPMYVIEHYYLTGSIAFLLNLIHFPSMSQKFRALDEFQFYMQNNRMMVYYILVFGGTTKTAIVVSTLALRMLKALHQVKNQLSSGTLSRHKIALRCLILQFMTTPIAFVPPCMLAVVVWFPTQYSQVISWFALMCMTTHSIVNSTVVILTYPEFRKAVMFWKSRSGPKR
ncbi:unnamed protein product [Caenorhabditis brenneri]